MRPTNWRDFLLGFALAVVLTSAVCLLALSRLAADLKEARAHSAEDRRAMEEAKQAAKPERVMPRASDP